MLVLASFIMRSRWTAILVFTICLGLSFNALPVLIVACATIALVALRNGPIEAIFVLLIGSALTSAFAALGSAGTHMVQLVGIRVTITVVPVLIMATALRRSGNWGTVLAIAAVICGFWVSVVYSVLDSPAAWWTEQLEATLTNVQGMATGPEAKQTIAQFAPHMTGLLGGVLLLFCAVGLMLGRWFQSLLYNPGGFRKEFHALRLTRVHSLVLLGFVFVGWIAGDPLGGWASDIGSVLIAMFIIPGIALAHVWANQLPFTTAALVGFYIAIFIVPHLAAALGWMDSWLDLRSRWTQRPSNGADS